MAKKCIRWITSQEHKWNGWRAASLLHRMATGIRVWYIQVEANWSMIYYIGPLSEWGNLLGSNCNSTTSSSMCHETDYAYLSIILRSLVSGIMWRNKETLYSTTIAYYPSIKQYVGVRMESFWFLQTTTQAAYYLLVTQRWFVSWYSLAEWPTLQLMNRLLFP